MYTRLMLVNLVIIMPWLQAADIYEKLKGTSGSADQALKVL